MAKLTSKKIIVTYPSTGTERKFDAAIYESFKAAIIKSLEGSTGKTFSALADDVTAIIRKDQPGFSRSIPWYTISVKRDLETRGIVEAIVLKGKKLNRLKKK